MIIKIKSDITKQELEKTVIYNMDGKFLTYEQVLKLITKDRRKNRG